LGNYRRRVAQLAEKRKLEIETREERDIESPITIDEISVANNASSRFPAEFENPARRAGSARDIARLRSCMRPIDSRSHSCSLFQIVAVPVLRAMSWSRRHAVVGAAGMAESVPAAVLSHVPEVRPGALPVSSGSATLGHRLFGNRRRRGSGWPAIRTGRPLHRRALRGLAHLLDHSPGLDRHADHRADTAEYRTRHDRGPVQHGDRQFTVSRLCFRRNFRATFILFYCLRSRQQDTRLSDATKVRQEARTGNEPLN